MIVVDAGVLGLYEDEKNKQSQMVVNTTQDNKESTKTKYLRSHLHKPPGVNGFIPAILWKFRGIYTCDSVRLK